VGQAPFRLDPFGMLNAQGMVDLLLELNVRSGFRHYLITHFDGLHGRICCSKRNLKEATTARAQRCGEVATWWPC
jgi:hypothetical protein